MAKKLAGFPCGQAAPCPPRWSRWCTHFILVRIHRPSGVIGQPHQRDMRSYRQFDRLSRSVSSGSPGSSTSTTSRASQPQTVAPVRLLAKGTTHWVKAHLLGGLALCQPVAVTSMRVALSRSSSVR